MKAYESICNTKEIGKLVAYYLNLLEVDSDEDQSKSQQESTHKTAKSNQPNKISVSPRHPDVFAVNLEQILLPPSKITPPLTFFPLPPSLESYPLPTSSASNHFAFPLHSLSNQNFPVHPSKPPATFKYSSSGFPSTVKNFASFTSNSLSNDSLFNHNANDGSDGIQQLTKSNSTHPLSFDSTTVHKVHERVAVVDRADLDDNEPVPYVPSDDGVGEKWIVSGVDVVESFSEFMGQETKSVFWDRVADLTPESQFTMPDDLKNSVCDQLLREIGIKILDSSMDWNALIAEGYELDLEQEPHVIIANICDSYPHVKGRSIVDARARCILDTIKAFAERFKRGGIGYSDYEETDYIHKFIRDYISSPFIDDEELQSLWREEVLDATKWRKNIKTNKMTEKQKYGHKVDGLLRDLDFFEYLVAELANPNLYWEGKLFSDAFKLARGLRDVYCHTAKKIKERFGRQLPKSFAVMGIQGFKNTLKLRLLIYKAGYFWLVPLPNGTILIPQCSKQLKYLNHGLNMLHFVVKDHINRQRQILAQFVDDATSFTYDKNVDQHQESLLNTRTTSTPKKQKKT
ncbi:hypothetical protein HK098_003219 [Nowakowskiella sp. JEL0407]|nr:hypothetical protein HK098_003219 [Nowakowskiella sp. JEL0407]